jgi:hypothetical protein
MMNRGKSEVAKALKRNGDQMEAKEFRKVVIRRQDPVATLKQELAGLDPSLRDQRLVVFASPAVDVAATLPLAEETVTLTKTILEATNWDVRLLSKSPLLTRIAEQIPDQWHQRVIYGLSSGTLDDQVASAIEPDAPLPSKRIESLVLLQQRGHRTFAMLCPILPQDLVTYASALHSLIDLHRCEDVWAEVLNRRGKSMTMTLEGLELAGLHTWAQQLRRVFGLGSTPLWEAYARSTFAALTATVPLQKLHFLQYVTHESLAWWRSQSSFGAIPLGKITRNEQFGAENGSNASNNGAFQAVGVSPAERKRLSSTQQPSDTNASGTSQETNGSFPPAASPPQTPAKKAWVTMRKRYTPAEIRKRSHDAALKAWETRRANAKLA